MYECGVFGTRRCEENRDETFYVTRDGAQLRKLSSWKVFETSLYTGLAFYSL